MNHSINYACDGPVAPDVIIYDWAEGTAELDLSATGDGHLTGLNRWID